jgi:hypothetical protein
MKSLFSLLLTLIILVFAGGVYSQRIVDDSTRISGMLKTTESTGDPLSKGCYSVGQVRFLAGDTISIIGYEKCYPYGDLKAVPKAYYIAMYDAGAVYLPETSVAILGNLGNQFQEFSVQDFIQLERNTRGYFNEISARKAREKLEAQRIADSLARQRMHLQDSLETIRQKKFGEYIKKCELKGIGVFSFGAVDASEYTEGTGVEMTFYNPTKKIVKYVHATVVGYNAVNDPVIESGKNSHTLKCIGPINPGEDGTYNFEYVWFTDIVETAKLTSIKVQYMDGTEKIISKPSEVIIPKALIKE